MQAPAQMGDPLWPAVDVVAVVGAQVPPKPLGSVPTRPA